MEIILFFLMIVLTLSELDPDRGTNLVKNKDCTIPKYTINQHHYDRIRDRDISHWREDSHRQIDITTFGEFQEYFAKVKSHSQMRRDHSMCLLREGRNVVIEQNLWRMEDGWYHLKISAVATELQKQPVRIGLRVTRHLEKLVDRKVEVPSDGQVHQIQIYFLLKQKGNYQFQFYTPYNQEGTGMMGVTNILLQKWGAINFLQTQKWHLSKKNKIKNGLFLHPLVPAGQKSKMIYSKEAAPWFLKDFGEIVKSSFFNALFPFEQAYLFSRHKDHTYLRQLFHAKKSCKYFLRFYYTETKQSCTTGQVIISINNKQIGKISVKEERSPFEVFQINLTLIDKVNDLKFLAFGFSHQNRGIMISGVTIQSGWIPEISQHSRNEAKEVLGPSYSQSSI